MNQKKITYALSFLSANLLLGSFAFLLNAAIARSFDYREFYLFWVGFTAFPLVFFFVTFSVVLYGLMNEKPGAARNGTNPQTERKQD